MTTAIAGQRSGNAIVPYSQTTKQTKQYNLTVTGTNWVTTRAVGISYVDSLGNYRFRFNIQGSLTVAASSFILNVSGVTFKSGYSQCCSSYNSNATVTTFYANALPSSDDLQIIMSASNTSPIGISGDVELDSKPTWFDANMEALASADVYIEPASDTTAGLLSYYKTGAWVPNLKIGGGTTGITYTDRHGTYHRIGNRLFFDGYVALSSKGALTGDVHLYDLPFAGTGKLSAVSLWLTKVGRNGYKVVSYAGAAQTYFGFGLLPINADTGTTIALTNAYIDNTSEFIFSGNYSV